MKTALEGAGFAPATLHASRGSANSKSTAKGFADMLAGDDSGKTAPEPKSSDDVDAIGPQKPVRAGDFRRSLPEFFPTPGQQGKTIARKEVDPTQVALPTEPVLKDEKAASDEVEFPFPNLETAIGDDLQANPGESPAVQSDPDEKNTNDATEMGDSGSFPAHVRVLAVSLSAPPPVIPLPTQRGEARSTTEPLVGVEAASPNAEEAGNAAVDLVVDEKPAVRAAPPGGPINSPAVFAKAVDGQRGDRKSNPGGEPTPVRVVEAQVFPAPVQPAASGTIGSIVSAVAGSPEWMALAHRPAALQSAAHAASQNSPIRTLTIQLHPAELGMVTAKLRGSDEQLSIDIQVEKPEAYRQLSTDSEAILKAVRSLGIEIDRVTILQPPQGQTAAGTRGDSAGYSGSAHGDSFSASGGTSQDGERSGRPSQGNHSDETLTGSTGLGSTGEARPDRGVYI